MGPLWLCHTWTTCVHQTVTAQEFTWGGPEQWLKELETTVWGEAASWLWGKWEMMGETLSHEKHCHFFWNIFLWADMSKWRITFIRYKGKHRAAFPRICSPTLDLSWLNVEKTGTFQSCFLMPAPLFVVEWGKVKHSSGLTWRRASQLSSPCKSYLKGRRLGIG